MVTASLLCAFKFSGSASPVGVDGCWSLDVCRVSLLPSSNAVVVVAITGPWPPVILLSACVVVVVVLLPMLL